MFHKSTLAPLMQFCYSLNGHLNICLANKRVSWTHRRESFAQRP